jgi:glycosyltransferase involved in cell wall biosynthesis
LAEISPVAQLEVFVLPDSVSFYCTVLNEENSILSLIRSIHSQNFPPAEIVIVDGGSTDRTVELARGFSQGAIPIRVIEAKGANVAQGRNVGVANCQYEIVASSDADCRIDSNWLGSLISKLDKEVDIVGGVYLPDPKTFFEECLASFYPKVENLTADNFLPSHRSIAFRKKVWETLRFPEYCYRSEDTWFDIEAKKRGFKFAIAKDAKVYYRPRKNLREVYWAHYRDVKSDIENNVNTLFVRKQFLKSLVKLPLQPFVLLGNILATLPLAVSIKRAAYKNSFEYTRSVAIIFGYLAGKRAKKRHIQKQAISQTIWFNAPINASVLRNNDQ